MKKLNICSLALALALMVSLAVPVLAADPSGFSDVPASHTFYSGIMDCANKGITSGYEDGTFRPTNPVTRAQFCVMLARAFWPEKLNEYNTAENKALGWFVPASTAMYFKDSLAGTSFQYDYTGASTMNQPISRYDMARIMTNIMRYKGSMATDAQKNAVQSKIADYNTIPSQYTDAVKNVFALGIITGYADNTFSGNKIVNRGQACVIIYRMVQYTDTGSTGNNNTGTTEPSVTKPAETPITQPEAGTLANGQPITEENVLAIIQELLKKYPAGMKWDSNTTRPGTPSAACNKITKNYSVNGGGISSMKGGCGGFASLISDTIFGSENTAPARRTTVSKVRPGDIIIIIDKNNKLTHIATAASKVTGIAEWGDGVSPVITIYDGNVGNNPSEKHVRYNPDYAIPPTYSDYYDYYVEVWTRYPTDGESVNYQSQNTSSSDAAYVKTVTPANTNQTDNTSTSPSTTTYNPKSNDNCDLCNQNSPNKIFNANMTKCICYNCYQTKAGKAYIDD